MTITEIATLITSKLGRTDSSSLSICKDFIKRRYQMVYDSTLWLESLATTFAHVQDRDVTISTAPEVYYAGGSAAKIDRVLAVNYSESTTYSITDIAVGLSAGVYHYKYETPDTSMLSVGDTVYIYGMPSSATLPTMNGVKTVRIISANSYFTDYAPSHYTAEALGLQGFTGFFTKDKNPFENIGVEDWWHHFRVDPSVLIEQTTTTSKPTGFFHLPKDSSGNPRIRLNPTPPKEGLLHVLGKLGWTEPADGDSPVIHGIDNILLAYAEGDMLERGRKYAKAQLKYQEAGDLLSAARDQQRNQFASESRIVPDMVEDSYVRAFGYAG